MAQLMPRFSIFQVAIIVLLISACVVNGQVVDVNIPGTGGINFQAGVGVGVQAGGYTGADVGVPGANNGDAQPNAGNVGVWVGVPVGQGPNTGGYVPGGNTGAGVGVTDNTSVPVMPGPNTGVVTGRRRHRYGGFIRGRPGIPVGRPREFLRAHNKARAVVNMPPFKWDKRLARYARRWAAQRALDCNMIHSFGIYGENIFWGEKDEWSPTQVVESWVSEHEFYDGTKNECAPGQMCGHYTQVIWLDTTNVGCAIVTCLNGGMFATCNYDPPGNYVGESPFTHFAV